MPSSAIPIRSRLAHAPWLLWSLVSPLVLALALALALSIGCHSSASASKAEVSNAQEPGDRATVPSSAGPTSQNATDGGEAAGAEDPGPPNVQLIGRFDQRDPAGPACAWPGCRVIARFNGTTVSARFRERDAFWMAGSPSEWDVAIDGEWKPKLVMPSNEDASVELARGLPEGVHQVELYKRTESQNGVTQFLGFDFGGGTLLPPPLRKHRRIEVIGDSAAAGFGIEGVGLGPDCPGDDWAAQWQNFHRSFGPLLSESLGAELAGTVYSGKGIAQNIYVGDDETMPTLFLRANPTDPTSSWDFSSFVPDVVVIMMGGNDFAIGQPYDEGPASVEAFTAAYDAFVALLREKYAHAHLFLTASPSTSDDQPPGRSTRTNVLAGIHSVLEHRHAVGDAQVYGFNPQLATPAELRACNGHGTPEFHQRVARELATTVREKTGW